MEKHACGEVSANCSANYASSCTFCDSFKVKCPVGSTKKHVQFHPKHMNLNLKNNIPHILNLTGMLHDIYRNLTFFPSFLQL